MIRTKLIVAIILACMDSSGFASCLYIWLVWAEKGFEDMPHLTKPVSINVAALQRIFTKSCSDYDRTGLFPSNIYYN